MHPVCREETDACATDGSALERQGEEEKKQKWKVEEEEKEKEKDKTEEETEGMRRWRRGTTTKSAGGMPRTGAPH